MHPWKMIVFKLQRVKGQGLPSFFYPIFQHQENINIYLIFITASQTFQVIISSPSWFYLNIFSTIRRLSYNKKKKMELITGVHTEVSVWLTVRQSVKQSGQLGRPRFEYLIYILWAQFSESHLIFPTLIKTQIMLEMSS